MGVKNCRNRGDKWRVCLSRTFGHCLRIYDDTNVNSLKKSGKLGEGAISLPGIRFFTKVTTSVWPQFAGKLLDRNSYPVSVKPRAAGPMAR